MTTQFLKTHWSTEFDICGMRISNFGDMLTPFIFDHYGIPHVNETIDKAQVIGIGSLLHSLPDDFDGQIWTSGALFDRKKRIGRKPLAVRGKLTLATLEYPEDDDIETCLGDGGLILDRIYRPPKTKKYKLGVMPHYIDLVALHETIQHYYVSSEIEKWPIFNNDRVLFINVNSPIRTILEQMNECENIVASCLHGIVACDSYKIPHALISLQRSAYFMHQHEKSFKFRDYYSTFDMEFTPPKMFTPHTTLEECLKWCGGEWVNKPGIEFIKNGIEETLKSFI